TGKYIYKTRTTWVDKENFYMQFHVTTDPRDNVMRIWDDSRAFRPRTGEAQWRYVIVSNYVNQRFNFLQMEPVWENRAELVGEEKFDVDQLRDYQ
ncbi:MAG: outer membrane lipoprotein-sorting protein, partial [Gammaproteobacteria bacterium]